MSEAAEVEPTLEEWRRLYTALGHVREIAPWAWMDETDVFGVQSPETGELVFVSIMGQLGEHYAVAAYQGAEGLHGFWDMHLDGADAMPMRLLEVPQLQASLEDRELVERQDREIIKQLGLKFRGRQSWPLFRSFRPGFPPWFISGAEARLLAYALEQVPDVTLRFKENARLLDPQRGKFNRSFPPRDYLVRIAGRQGDELHWEDRRMAVPPPEPQPIPLAMNMELLAHLKAQPRTQHVLELDLFLLPTPVAERGARPYYPYVLLAVEAKQGVILGTELLAPTPQLRDMWGTVALHLAYQLANANMVPKSIKLCSPLLYTLIQPLAQELKISLKQAQSLPMLEEAQASLFQNMFGFGGLPEFVE